MSEDIETGVICCASCGIAEDDNGTKLLKDCDECDLVKYCSDTCHKNHREHHEEECKKRAAELHDKKLFTPPDGSHLGECPICFLPLPIEIKKSTLMSCCCKYICKGCQYANSKREFEGGLEQRCAYCREPVPESEEEADKNCMERAKKNDPLAIREVGMSCGEEGDHEAELEYYTKAAALGDAGAHYNLSIMYLNGRGVEKDEEKEVYHLEQAAIGGHPYARHDLGCNEWNNGSFERAVKHFVIAANLGVHNSPKSLRRLYVEGHASKEDYVTALRAYQAAKDATKSSQRDVGEAYWNV